MKHLEGSWGSGFRPNGTVRKDVGQRYEEEPSYVLDCKLQIGAVSSLSFIFYIFRTRVTKIDVKLILEKIPGWKIRKNIIRKED